MSLESLVQEVVEGQKDSKVGKGFLYLLSLGFGFISRLRHALYDKGWLTCYQSSLPVVSVGNLVAGGTGKTPFVKKLLDDLNPAPGSIAILTRGYRAKDNKHSLEVSSGFGPKVTVQEAGDEPYWLSQKTQAAVWRGKNRVRSAKLAKERGSRLLLLEDGFQHRRLAKDLEIVLLHAGDLWGKGYFLPRGYLRDVPSRLEKADFVVITHVEESEKTKEEILRTIARFTKAPVIGLQSVYRLEKEAEGRRIGAFCGIAKPSFFYETLQKKGLLVRRYTSDDHVVPSLERLREFSVLCEREGAECLVCTEKDRVKLPLDASLSLPLYTMDKEFVVTWGESYWEKMIQEIRTLTETICRKEYEG